MYWWQSFILGLCEHLAWPSVVVFCVIFFNNDIRKILSRLTKLPGGAELSPETVEEQQDYKSKYDQLAKQREDERKKLEDDLKEI